MLQAIWKAQEPLKSSLNIIRHVPIQHVTCDCLFQRRDDACESWRLAQNIITLGHNVIRFVTSAHGDHTAA